jgi:hypothetical protein
MFGPETKFVCGGGSVQFGWKLDANVVRARTRLKRAIANTCEEGMACVAHYADEIQ